MNTEQYIKTSEAISNHPTQVRGTYYRIAWCHNGEQGEEKDFYTSFASAYVASRNSATLAHVNPATGC